MRKDWEVKKLGDICNALNGLWTGKKPPFIPVFVIRNTNFSKDCRLILNDVAIIEVEKNQYLSRKLIYGDIIIEKSGGSDKQPVGRPVIFKIGEGEYSFSNFTTALRIIDKSKIFPDFLYYQLKFFYFDGRTLKMQTKTTGLRNLQLNSYLKQKVSIPCFQIQQQIVEELDCLTSIIEKQKKQLEELDNLAQSIFYDMFGDPIENEKGWDTKKMNDLCSKITDGEHIKPPVVKEGVPFLSAKDITNGFVDFSETLYVSKDFAKKSRERCNPEYGDILIISRGATIGKICMIRTHKEFCLLGSVILIKYKETIDGIFLLYFLKNPGVQVVLRTLCGALAQPAIYLKDIKKINVLSPPLPLQQQFAAKIEAIEKQKELIKKSIKETEDLFNSRMDYYFN